MSDELPHLTRSDLMKMLTNVADGFPPLDPNTPVYIQVGGERRPLIAVTTQYSDDPPTHVILKDLAAIESEEAEDEAEDDEDDEPKETLADFQRAMAPEIAQAGSRLMQAVNDPDRTEASVKVAMMQYMLAIRLLVNRFHGLPDDSGFPPAGEA